MPASKRRRRRPTDNRPSGPTITVRIDLDTRKVLAELAPTYGGRSAVIKASIAQLIGRKQRQQRALDRLGTNLMVAADTAR